MQSERLVNQEMEELLTNRLTFEICKTKQNLASKEKVSHCQRFHLRQVLNPESKCQSDPI